MGPNYASEGSGGRRGGRTREGKRREGREKGGEGGENRLSPSCEREAPPSARRGGAGAESAPRAAIPPPPGPRRRQPGSGPAAGAPRRAPGRALPAGMAPGTEAAPGPATPAFDATNRWGEEARGATAESRFSMVAGPGAEGKMAAEGGEETIVEIGRLAPEPVIEPVPPGEQLELRFAGVAAWVPDALAGTAGPGLARSSAAALKRTLSALDRRRVPEKKADETDSMRQVRRAGHRLSSSSQLLQEADTNPACLRVRLHVSVYARSEHFHSTCPPPGL